MSPDENSAYPRLEDQIRWYDVKSQFNQRRFKTLKAVELISAALIPLVAGFSFLNAIVDGVGAIVLGTLGALIVVLEGFQHLNQYHHNWVTYRSTCEALRHEKYLYMARTGPYDIKDAAVARKELAARVEALVSTEHAKWVGGREQSRKQLQRDDA